MAKTRVIVTPGGIGEIEGNRARLGHIRRPIPSGVVKPPSTVSSQTSPSDLMIGSARLLGRCSCIPAMGHVWAPGQAACLADSAGQTLRRGLLRHMPELMGKEPTPGRGSRRIPIGAKNDIVPDRIGTCI